MSPATPSRGEAARKLIAEIEHYERVIDGLKALRDRDGRDRLHELVRVRRALAEHIVLLRDAGVSVFADRPELLREFRARLSTIMNRTALHQADWPAVTLDRDEEGYRQSATALGLLQRDFIAWLRDEMASGEAARRAP